MGPTVIDVFCGAGGLSQGFRQAGFDLVFGIDWNEHACETHRRNHPKCLTLRKDLTEVKGSQILRATGHDRIDVVIGGPNCQGVSERGLRNPRDPRNRMFVEFRRMVKELRPRWFLMENVPGLAHRHNFGLVRAIFESFNELGYKCAADVLRAADYGVPQLRYRFFLVGTRDDAPILFPPPTHIAPDEPRTILDLARKPHVTVWEAISDLPPIEPGWDQDAMPYPDVQEAELSEYQRTMRRGSDAIYNHVCARTAPINLRRISFVPEGGNWKDIPRRYLPPRFLHVRFTDHSTTYARLRRDHPSFTITALLGNVTAGAFTHPTQDRAVGVRDGARLQGFPDHYRFYGPRNSQYRQVGNSVPPILAAQVASAILAAGWGGRASAGVAPRLTQELMLGKARWEDLPILTPRYKSLFGTGTRWPKGWGPRDAPGVRVENYRLVRGRARGSKSP